MVEAVVFKGVRDVEIAYVNLKKDLSKSNRKGTCSPKSVIKVLKRDVFHSLTQSSPLKNIDLAAIWVKNKGVSFDVLPDVMHIEFQ